MKTAILLGAGSSLPARYPSTQELTALILSGDGVERHTDETYYVSDHPVPMNARVRTTNSIVRRLHEEAERYFSISNGRPTNYEDVFYLAKQVLDEVQGEMENPAIRQFVIDLEAEILQLVEASSSTDYLPHESYQEQVSGNAQTLFDEACNYISDIVSSTLARNPTSTDHLRILVEACGGRNIVGIATLNHDTHVEAHLRAQGLVVADGFSDERAGVRFWNGDFSPNGRIPFLKLHGSTDWYRLRPDDADEAAPWHSERIGIPLDGEPYRARTVDAVLQWPPDGRPLLLIGTFNKAAQYSEGIFRELHYRFRTTLRSADQLCVCGYSFGDKGINSEIIEWYYEKRGRGFLIIHPDSKALIMDARGAVRNKWDEWTASGSIKLLPKKLEDVGTDEFLQLIHCSS